MNANAHAWARTTALETTALGLKYQKHLLRDGAMKSLRVGY
jgi:hypothetical protein